MLADLGDARSPMGHVVHVADHIRVQRFGIVGLAMQHAGSFLEAVDLSLRYPQLFWGHCRVRVVATQEDLSLVYSIERAKGVTVATEESNRLADYCLSIDLIAMANINSDILGKAGRPIRIAMPFSEPFDWPDFASDLPCPVDFDALEGRIVYPASVERAVPLHAERLSFRAYKKAADHLGRMLVDDKSLSEQVMRWLWAYSPPPKRGEIAKILAMSERSLARGLKAEGASFNALLAEVQAERAKNLLKRPDLSIAAVSYRLGYAEPAAFTRAFASWTGQAPSAWRAQNA
jgi:AraC-like DNA-binding protein